MIRETEELAASIRIALELVPEDELLDTVEASNSVRVEPNWRTGEVSNVQCGIREIAITTINRGEQRKKTYLLLDGTRLGLVREEPLR